jgi:hypothetical protein
MALDNDQYTALAKKVVGTKSNIYSAAEWDYGHEWEDEDFATLEKLTGVFQCELCDTFKDKRQKSRDLSGVCEACASSLP